MVLATQADADQADTDLVTGLGSELLRGDEQPGSEDGTGLQEMTASGVHGRQASVTGLVQRTCADAPCEDRLNLTVDLTGINSIFTT
jgi:hypothetical protein